MIMVIVIAGLASLFDAIDAKFLGYALPGISKEFGLKPQTLGLIASSTMAGMTIGSFIWGWIADKSGRRMAFIVTILLYSVFSGLSAAAFSVGFLVAVRFATGLGLGGAIPVDAAILTEFAPARIRGFSAGVSPLVFPIGTLIAAVIALFAVPKIGWRGLFLLGVLPALLTVWARRKVPESPRWLINRDRADEARKALHYIGISDDALQRSRVALLNEPPLPRLPKPHFLDLFTPEMRRGTTHTWILWSLTQMGNWGMTLWLPTFFVQLHGTTVKQALSYVVYVSSAAVVGKLSAWLVLDRIGRKPILIFGFGCAGLSLYALGLAHSAIGFAIGAAFYTAFTEMGYLAITPYTAEIYPLHIRGMGTAAAMGVGRCGGAIAPSIIGVLIGAGHPGWIWIYLGTCCLVAVAFTIWLGVETRGRNLEQLTKAATEGAAKLRGKEQVKKAVSASTAK
jgi:putative MFS transporter